jgi:hypothetical protein
MKKIALGLLFALLGSAAQAEWGLYAGGIEKDKPFAFYIDNETIKYNGKYSVEIWTLYDFPKGRVDITRENEPYSFVNLRRYYCSTRLIEDVYQEVFSGSMGQGTTTFKRTQPLAPVPIVPNSQEDRILKKFCK